MPLKNTSKKPGKQEKPDTSTPKSNNAGIDGNAESDANDSTQKETPEPSKLRGIAMLLAAAKRPRQWIVDGLLEVGDQMLIAGAPKTGKSRMAIQLSLAVATGGEFLGYQAVKPMRVLYFNLELREDRFGARILAVMGDEQKAMNIADRFFAVNDFRTVDVLNLDTYTELRTIVDEAQPDLVVWDVLARMHKVEEKDAGEMKAVMMAVRAISGRAASIVVHHTRKPSQESGGIQNAADIRGSGALHGEVDSALVLSRRTGSGARYSLSFSCRNVNTPDDMLLDVPEDGSHFFLASEAEADRLKVAWQRAYTKHGVGRNITAKALKESIKDYFDITSDSQVKAYIKAGVDAGWATREHEGRNWFYTLADTAPIMVVASNQDLNFGI